MNESLLLRMNNKLRNGKVYDDLNNARAMEFKWFVYILSASVLIFHGQREQQQQKQ